ncbi:MAG: AmmeMemoRadiSam system protein B [Magnetococcales bacterium]|nr:AmmeMemoRadiSam system protein B [Magnetococcales bacterium]
MEQQGVRPAAVAGTFYPQDPQQLRDMVRGFLIQAPASPQGEPKALISPHAGYIYSGQVAAYGYKNLPQAPADNPRRVFVLAPSHRVYLDGVSVGNFSAYQTPLGEVEIDQAVVDRLAAQPDVSRDPQSHQSDHALEVQIPFLQETVVHFKLVPIMFGDISGGQLADLIDSCWQPGDLIIISSDLSHFHPYQKAMALDQQSHQAVLSQKPRAIESCEACGRTGMSALLEIARRHRWSPSLSNYCNSGDTAGDKNRVVGYATYLFYPNQTAAVSSPPPTPRPDQTTLPAALPALVRRHLEAKLAGQEGNTPNNLMEQFPDLSRQGATFITLTKAGVLRGCIGSLVAHRSLAEDLLENGLSAARRDPRFPPVSREELDQLKVEVSLLSSPEPLLYRDSDDLLACLKPGVHGVILKKSGRQSTFLPQVWEQIPDKVTFMEHLCAKAGLGGSCWQDNPQILTYTVEKIKETSVD